MDAQRIVRVLGGRWLGGYGMACCPAHEDSTPSLSVAERDGRVLVHCHAGCEQQAVVDALVKRGLWRAIDGRHSIVRRPVADRVEIEKAQQSYLRKEKLARKILQDAAAAEGSPVEAYLRGRGIAVPAPDCLRFAARLKHGPTGRSLPAMVAAVQAPDGRISAIHRTFLDVTPEGVRKASCEPARMMLGRCAGGAVRLTCPGSRLALAEGIETALSVHHATGKPTWATLGTSGLRAVIVPPEVREILICADGDDPGRQAADAAAQRFLREGRNVRVAIAPGGHDFNDVLTWPDHVVPLAGRRTS